MQTPLDWDVRGPRLGRWGCPALALALTAFCFRPARRKLSSWRVTPSSSRSRRWPMPVSLTAAVAQHVSPVRAATAIAQSDGSSHW